MPDLSSDPTPSNFELMLSKEATDLEKFLSNYQPLDKHRRSDAINAARREALEYASDLRCARSPEDRAILTKHVIRLSTIYTYLTGRNLDLNLPS